ncbi:MAG: ABC transporter permease [Acidobacteriota bacterium]|nr:ABC transporter permease [Acidobacteriota bacterium]
MTARLFRALLLCYPQRFRHLYGTEMELVFRRRLSRARDRGPAAYAGSLARAYVDLVIGAAAERFAPPLSAPSKDPMTTLFVRDLRMALRMLRRQPAFSATVVLTLAVAIGTTTAIASLVDAAIVRPLPYPGAGRLVSVVEESARFGKVPFAPPFLRDFREQTTRFDAVAAFTATWHVTVTGAGDARSVPAAFVSDGLFEMFGARAATGRLLTAGDHNAAAPVAVVSQAMWSRTFGAGTPLGGQIVRVDDRPITIIGIVAGDFRMPITASVAVTTRDTAEMWLPMSLNPLATLRTIPVANIVGRLKADATVDEARIEIAQLPARWSRTYREVPAAARYTAVPLASLVSEPVRRPLLALLSGVVVLLLIACANVASLMLARSASQASDLAVRAALGATRMRLVQQMLADSLVLAGAGTLLGLLFAWMAIGAVPSLALGDLPPSATIAMDWRVVAIAGLAGLIVALSVAVVPAVLASRLVLYSKIRDGARTVGGRGVRSALALAEVALALVLLVSAGLLARSFLTLSRVDPGFRAGQLVASGVSLPGTRYPTPESRRAFVDRTLDGMAVLPGVTRVAAVNRLPLGGGNVTVGVEIEGQPQPDGPVSMDRRVVTPGYFEALGIPLEGGRMFGTEDRPDAIDRVVAVNGAVARRFWPRGDAIGQRLRLMLRGGPGPWLRVTGVVGDVRHHGLDRAAHPEVYVPYAQASVESMVFLAQAGGDPASLREPIRQVVQGLDPLLPLRQEMPADLIRASVAEPRLRALLFNGFAVAALLLSALGIYGVVAQAVEQRTREIGVRVALGATRGSILSLVLRGGMRLVVLGIAGGLAASALVTRALRGLLFGVPALDPLTFAVVTALLLVVGTCAMLIPARRAMRLDPIEALRGE